MSAVTVAEYIWLDANKKFRSKVRTIHHENFTVPQYPDWDYDGSSTGQADGNSSEITIRPVFVCDNPLSNFRDNHIMYSKLVLCETLNIDGTPTNSNTRARAYEIFSLPICQSVTPWFGLEQEYFIIDNTPHGGVMKETSEHYCGVGRGVIYRNIAEEHMAACIKARINISGMNAEVSQNQWEFQIGPSVGIKASDELLMARFILERIAEKYGKTICYDPKPFANINGSGCHTNFSTSVMRSDGGIKEIYRVIQNMENSHADNIKLYGENNDKRLSGNHETSDFKKFTWGIGNRGVSVRINNRTKSNGFGYFEDRRPAANMDPYLVTSAIMANVIF
jgi:glutamine synthetase